MAVMISFQVVAGTDVYNDGVFIETPDDSGKLDFRKIADNVKNMYSVQKAEVGDKWPFSFHPKAEIPQHVSVFGKLMFNCSVPHYDSFKQHLHCNLRPECVGGEDEGEHCPYSRPGCGGLVGYNQKCFYIVSGKLSSQVNPCAQSGGSVAMPKTKEELAALISSLQCSKLTYRFLMLGVQVVHPVSKEHIKRNPMPGGIIIPFTQVLDEDCPEYYRGNLVWLDGTVAYQYGSAFLKHFRHECVMGISSTLAVLPTVLITKLLVMSPVVFMVCQTEANTTTGVKISTEKVRLPLPRDTASQHTNPSLVPCPNGHVTWDFLGCDAESRCGTEDWVSECTLSGEVSDWDKEAMVSMFTCDERRTLHYTLVCDFLPHCDDRADEMFCRHPDSCNGFTCTNGQCVDRDKVDDHVSNCVDGSDEDWQNSPQGTCLFADVDLLFQLQPPTIIDFEYGGRIRQRHLEAAESCPETHFWCPGESGLCLPVYVRCNGVYDCVGHGDEADCHNYTCPGFYHCRTSSVCVHLSHLCDGWPQCPQRDDELLCGLNLICPEGCLCQGLVFLCRQPFEVRSFSDLRYLDMSEVQIQDSDLINKIYLIWLRLSMCSLKSLPKIDFPNLRHLDLTDNEIHSLTMSTFYRYPNLRVVILKGNPVTSLQSSLDKHPQLKSLDLSDTGLSAVTSHMFTVFSNLQVLNISEGKLAEISDGGFSGLHSLQILDIRGRRVHYPADALKDLVSLRVLYTSNFELCCEGLLPSHFVPDSCFHFEEKAWSCGNLLMTNYRLFLWLTGVLALGGNTGSFLYRLVIHSGTTSGHAVFISNLCLADFLMGVYLTIIGVVDKIYQDNYYLFTNTWIFSIGCQVAGFLSLVSSEVSAFTISLITLDRFIVLRFPFSTVRFTRRSALYVCLATWLLGGLLAGVPLLPATSHWRLYSQNGLCAPLPIATNRSWDQDYSFVVMVIINFFLFVLIAVGQGFIFWSVILNSIASEATSAQEQTIARRLLAVAVSDFLCWFPVGLLGLLAKAGVPVRAEVNVFIVVFVLPLNSALNPFLYTLNVVREKRRRAWEARRRQATEAQPCQLNRPLSHNKRQ